MTAVDLICAAGGRTLSGRQLEAICWRRLGQDDTQHGPVC